MTAPDKYSTFTTGRAIPANIDGIMQAEFPRDVFSSPYILRSQRRATYSPDTLPFMHPALNLHPSIATLSQLTLRFDKNSGIIPAPHFHEAFMTGIYRTEASQHPPAPLLLPVRAYHSHAAPHMRSSPYNPVAPQAPTLFNGSVSISGSSCSCGAAPGLQYPDCVRPAISG